MAVHLPGMQVVAGSNPRGGRIFSHGKLSKNNYNYIKTILMQLYIQNYHLMLTNSSHISYLIVQISFMNQILDQI